MKIWCKIQVIIYPIATCFQKYVNGPFLADEEIAGYFKYGSDLEEIIKRNAKNTIKRWSKKYIEPDLKEGL